MLKTKLKKWWLGFKNLVSTPTMLVSLFIAWMITNGWSYIFLGIGIWLKIGWMKGIGIAYLTILWLPFTPEKLITIPLSLYIQKLLFKKERGENMYLIFKRVITRYGEKEHEFEGRWEEHTEKGLPFYESKKQALKKCEELQEKDNESIYYVFQVIKG